MKKTVYGILILLSSCGENSGGVQTDTATSGHIVIAADESLRPIVEAEEAVFESIYRDADLEIVYTNEHDAIQLVCRDSARLAIVTRELLPEEKAFFDRDKITPRYSPFAYDGIAIVLNKAYPDSVFTITQLAGLLETGVENRKIQVVFDSPKSGAIRYLRDSVLKGKELGKHCFAVETNRTVIEHVEKNRDAIGIIGVAWISDQDDSVMHSFTNRIRVAGLVPRDPATAEAGIMKPYQAYIGLKQYPLWRRAQLVSREARVGLGTGFASFIASDRGQRIVLKAGLVPAQAPIRIVNINNSSIE